MAKHEVWQAIDGRYLIRFVHTDTFVFIDLTKEDLEMYTKYNNGGWRRDRDVSHYICDYTTFADLQDQHPEFFI